MDELDPTLCTGRFSIRCESGLPQSYGVGASIKPGSGRTTINVDVVRIKYSQVTPGLALGTNDLPAIVDGTELHIGGEYGFALPRQLLLSVRAGAYTDPGHHPYEGTVGPIRARPPLDTSTTHFAAGTGLAIGQVIQIDGAFVRSTHNREFLLSTVVRF